MMENCIYLRRNRNSLTVNSGSYIFESKTNNFASNEAHISIKDTIIIVIHASEV